jgi:hypothetical protein
VQSEEKQTELECTETKEEITETTEPVVELHEFCVNERNKKLNF